MAYAIPDIPEWVENEIAKMEFQRREALKVGLLENKNHHIFFSPQRCWFFVRKQLKRGFEAELSRVTARKNDYNEGFASLASNFSHVQDSYPQESI